MKLYKNGVRKNIGSQSEIPRISINHNNITVSGYQSFIIYDDKIIYKSKVKKYKILEQLIDKFKFNCKSITDIGCSNGLVSFISSQKGYNVLALDHDVECINVMNRIITHFNINNIICKKFSFGNKINIKSDILIMLALIHWIYSCTALYGNFDKIFQYLSQYVNKYLLVEWICPNDTAICEFKHLNFNKQIHEEVYNIKNFENSLKKNIGRIVDKILIDKNTRFLYIVEKYT